MKFSIKDFFSKCDQIRENFIFSVMYRLDFLLQIVTMFNKIDNSIQGQRIRGLIGETASALNRTLVDRGAYSVTA